MKVKSILIFLIPLSNLLQGQKNPLDSLGEIIKNHKQDFPEVEALANFANNQSQIDSAIKYAQLGIELADKLKYLKGKANCLFILAESLQRRGNFSLAIQYALDALTIYHALGDNIGIAESNLLLQTIYRDVGEYRKSIDYALIGAQLSKEYHLMGRLEFPGHHLAAFFFAEIAQSYVLMNELDSALKYTQESISQHETFNDADWNFPVYLLATIQSKQGNYPTALKNYRAAIPLAIQSGHYWDTLQIFSGISTLYKNVQNLDSSIFYANLVAQSINPSIETNPKLEAITNLAEGYRLKGNKDSAIKYILLSHFLKDSLFSKEKDREVQSISFNQLLKQGELITAQVKYKSKVQLYTLTAGLFVLLLIATLLWRNNVQKQKAKIKIEQAYSNLKLTQGQLIQAEKMASLGELTAGIAHEIQNPLNFVNNFSEINAELAEEAGLEMDKGNYSEGKNILDLIKENEIKIIHHGKRADAIVKAMLQHAQTSTSQKELTDINKLAGEYLNISYGDLKIKVPRYADNKTLPAGASAWEGFDITLNTSFDSSIGSIPVIPKEMVRVLLNIYNNAFYSVHQKAIKISSVNQRSLLSPIQYEPTVTVRTKKEKDNILISIKDNGEGIPEKYIDKIFQPFFTTKPTGQNTGLGLSLAYDIIKSHGGSITVNSYYQETGVTSAGALTSNGAVPSSQSHIEGRIEGTEFIIKLPL